MIGAQFGRRCMARRSIWKVNRCWCAIAFYRMNYIFKNWNWCTRTRKRTLHQQTNPAPLEYKARTIRYRMGESMVVNIYFNLQLYLHKIIEISGLVGSFIIQRPYRKACVWKWRCREDTFVEMGIVCWIFLQAECSSDPRENQVPSSVAARPIVMKITT